MTETTIKHDNQILIGTNIKRIREEKHMKPKALVREVNLQGVDLNVFSLSKIEANTQHIKASQFKAIAIALQVDCLELLKSIDERQIDD